MCVAQKEKNTEMRGTQKEIT